jgi:hypothetical protein
VKMTLTDPIVVFAGSDSSLGDASVWQREGGAAAVGVLLAGLGVAAAAVEVGAANKGDENNKVVGFWNRKCPPLLKSEDMTEEFE